MDPTQAGVERVLVVDDEPDIVALVAYHLAKAGFRISTATSGPEALEQARRELPSIVVLDLMLPGMSGFDVLETLRRNESTRPIGVLMLTARQDEPAKLPGWVANTITHRTLTDSLVVIGGVALMAGR